MARGLYFADPGIRSSLKTVPALILHLGGRRDQRSTRLGGSQVSKLAWKGVGTDLTHFFLEKF